MTIDNCWGFFAVVVQSLASLAWPAAAASIVWLLREEVKKLLPRAYVEHGDFKIGFRDVQALIETVRKEEEKLIEKKEVQAAPAGVAVGLSNGELKEKASGIARRLRILDGKFREETSEFTGPRHRHGENDEELHRRFVKDSQALVRLHYRQQLEWHTTLLQETNAIISELCQRLGKDPDKETLGLKHVLGGSLSGAWPLADLAVLIDGLSLQLAD